MLRRGRGAEVVAAVAREIGAGAVYCTRHVEPFWRAADHELTSDLAQQGIEFRAFAGTTLFEPGSIAGKSGEPLRVFTPFWRRCLAASSPPLPSPAPSRLPRRQAVVSSEATGGLAPVADQAGLGGRLAGDLAARGKPRPGAPGRLRHRRPARICR